MRRDIPQPELREAIVETEGELAVAAARLGLARWQLLRYIDESPGLQSLLVDIKEGRDDEAESDLADAVFAGRLDAACFCLRTIGRRRGFGKPMTPEEEALVPNPGPMPSIHEAESLNEQQTAAYLRIAAKACPDGPARPAYFDRFDANRDELKGVIAENRGNLSRTAGHYDLTRSELVHYIQGDVELLGLIVDMREALLHRAEAVFELEECAKAPGPDMEKILMRFKSPIEARMIVENCNDLPEETRSVLQYQVWNHIEREYHPYTPIEKLPESRPPP